MQYFLERITNTICTVIIELTFKGITTTGTDYIYIDIYYETSYRKPDVPLP